MTENAIEGRAVVLAAHAHDLIAMAARAPSVHNTQPWRFRVAGPVIELYSDPGRKLQVDPAGREMLISCGAALFGLRLAVRSLGYGPQVELLPDPARLRLLARVRVGAAAPLTSMERQMIQAVPHRHTHRGQFLPGELPAGLVPGLQHDALAERATLALVGPGLAYQRLANIAALAASRLDLEPRARAEVRRWTRAPANQARDGVPVLAFGVRALRDTRRLQQRDFDLGRGLGRLPAGGQPPPVTAVLLTSGDSRADWLRAGQALHRLLLHAASRWVFASLYSQPLEAAVTRALIRDRLRLPGAPQMLLQLGRADTTHATARRPPADLTDP
ncbi:MAG: hypothetical protein JOY82_14925 [Streptosporangiaceae bacterium]|nr:hypothetical protein [Streptosporangiaceae bacterium]